MTTSKKKKVEITVEFAKANFRYHPESGLLCKVVDGRLEPCLSPWARCPYAARNHPMTTAQDQQVTPEEEAEKFIQAAIDSAPDQFRRLGEFLSRVLDEDQWAIAERLILGGLVAIQEGRDVLGDIDHYNESMERA